MKKLLALLMVLSMITAFIPTIATALPDDLTINVSTKESKAGEDVKLNVWLSSNPTVKTFSFIFKYNPAELTYKSGGAEWGTSTKDVPVFIRSITLYAPGEIRVSFLTVDTLPDVSDLLSITFTINSSLGAGYKTAPVVIAYEGAYNGFNTDTVIVTPAINSINNGRVTVVCINHTSDNAHCTNCEKASVCKICGKELEAAGSHSWATAWTSDGTKHWHTCQNGCAQVNGGAHDFLKVQTQEGTCVQTAKYAYRCRNCGYMERAETGSIDTNNHIWGDWVTVDPGGGSARYLRRVCERGCGAFETRDIGGSVNVVSISINASAVVAMKTGEVRKFEAIVNDVLGNIPGLEWTILNPAYATVTDGLVTIKNLKGTVVLMVSAPAYGQSHSITIRIT